MSAEPIVEFVPPKMTLDSVDVTIKEDNIAEIATTVTAWTNDTPIFDYDIGDTHIFRDGVPIYTNDKQTVYVDVIAIKVYDLYIHKILIDVAGEVRTVDLNDYTELEIVEDAEYPNVGIWVSI